jgi:hypothetical protein
MPLVSTGDVISRLQQIRLERAAADDEVRRHVARLRREGWTWALIGRPLGVTGQSVSRRYGEHPPRTLRDG